MKIKIQQFLFGKCHSWSIVAQNIAKQLIKNHSVDLVSTDGIKEAFISKELKKHIKITPDKLYDMQLSYTIPHNMPKFLNYGAKNRFGIWCYEFPIIPAEQIKYINSACDLLLPPSNFARDSFIECKANEDKIKVLPHGINLEDFENKNKYKISTNKKIKFLIPLGQPHLRKNIVNTVEYFFRTFSKNDDVVLILKAPNKKPGGHDISVNETVASLKKKYKNHPEIKLITDFVPNMVELYNACDVVYSLTRAEAFFMPALEGFAANKVVMVPRYGGQLDFCHDDNSILLDGKTTQADREALYWQGDIKNVWFESDFDDVSFKLKQVANNYDAILQSKQEKMKHKINEYTWENVTKQLIGYCK